MGCDLGRFDVIRLVMTEFLGDSDSVEDRLAYLSEEVISELMDAYPDVRYGSRVNLRTVMSKICGSQKTQFVIIIDEWDTVFREHKEDWEGQKKYLTFLRNWLKDKEYVALAYMTGILPVRKSGNQASLNMFDEYTMTWPGPFAPYVGFTSEEVEEKCREKGLNYAGFKSWYDGYRFSNGLPEWKTVGEASCQDNEVYCPYSVVNAMLSRQLSDYWNQTETYETLRQYIDLDFDGLKEDVAILMEDGRVPVDITGYQNDMTSFRNKDDILTMLIHLGYLGYDSNTKELFIPNREVLDVFKTSTKSRDWTVTFRALHNSQKLLEATWRCDQKTVTELLEAAHDKAGNKVYHSEAGLSFAVQLAYYAAQDLYTIIPEPDTGRGYADLAFIPVKPDIPAILIEFKYGKDADTAIARIHRQKYPDRLELYKGNLILVGINYDRTVSNDRVEFRHHSCKIEKA